MKEAASFRKRHQSDENVKDKEDSHSPFKWKPKEINIPFSDEPTLPLSCTSNVNLLADDNILEVVQLQLNESLDNTGNVLILNDDMILMSNEEQKEQMLREDSSSAVADSIQDIEPENSAHFGEELPTTSSSSGLPKVIDDIDRSILDDRYGPVWFTYADETARKLHTLIAEEILPKEHICFKLFYDVIYYIHTMSKGTNAEKVHWKWSEDVKEFLRAIRNIGKKRVIRLIRGPGYHRLTRWAEFSVERYNIPSPSLDALDDNGSGYTPRFGIIVPYLKACLLVCKTDSNLSLESNNLALVIPIIRSIDGFGLKAGCGRDQNLNELVAATVKIDVDYVKNNPKPDIPTMKNQLITEAEPEILATFDGKAFCVAGTNYVADPGTGQETLDL